MIIHQITNSQGNYNYNAFIYTDIIWDYHFHGNYELVYVIEGNTIVTCNGMVNTLLKNELILIPPYTTHSLQIGKNDKVWVGVFSEDFVTTFASANKFNSFSKFRCNKKVEPFLNECLFSENVPDRYLLKGCLYIVCSECVKSAEIIQNNQDINFSEKVIKYISQNLSEEITLKHLAKELNYEYHYFSSLFNQCFSLNFKSFLNMLRFEQACKLLSDHSLTATEVCNRCGFGSIRNFNRVFKSLSGYTPSKYRLSE